MSLVLLSYAKIKPNGKLIYNSIMHGPYVRRMIPEADRRWAECGIRNGNNAFLYKLSGIRFSQKCSLESWRSESARAEGNANGNNRNQIRCYNSSGMGHLARNYTIKPRRRDVAYLQTQLLITQKVEAEIQLQSEELDFMVATGDLDEIEEVNSNCILMANLQQASTSGTQTDNAPVYDNRNSRGGRIEIVMIMIYSICLLKKSISSVEQSGGTVEQNPTTVEETRAYFESLYNNLAIEEYKYDKISYDKAYNGMQQKIERLQAQLGDLKGKSQDTPCVSYNLDPLSQKLEDENVSLEFQVLNYAKENKHLKKTYKNLFDSIKETRAQTKLISDSLQEKLHDTIYENATLRAQLFDKVSKQTDTTKGTSVNTQFRKHSILGKPPSSSGSKLYFVTPLPKSKVLPKIDESNALSKPVTSNSAPSNRESKFVQNDKVIAPGIFRTHSLKNSRVDNFMPNKHVKESVRTKSITVSQPYVITKKEVNSNINGLPFIGVESTAKTRRP
ncbi:hypothetical protein Tco_1028207 [Tanacetum coccineum]|uniref:Gag-Pol polyprotein n=1 Tax=Tanacetum coccineum TaxID=301880 RepID=A0ABQ5G069_9ASTR